MFRLPPHLAKDFIDEMVAEGFENDSPIPMHTQVNFVLRFKFGETWLHYFVFFFQILATFNFFATGCYQRRVNAYAQMSQSTFGKILRLVTDFMADKMSAKYIKFPVTEAERQAKSEW